MKLKFTLSLIALLAASAGSHAAFQITFRAGDAVKILVDGQTTPDADGIYDTDTRPGYIAGGAFTLTDSTQSSFAYRFSTYSASINSDPTGGIDGDVSYSLGLRAPEVNGLTSGATGKTVSIYASADGLTSIIGEPAAASSGVTYQLFQPFPVTASNTAAVTYGAYYDIGGTVSSSPSGTAVLFGTDTLRGRTTQAEPNATAAFNNYIDTAPFASNTFAMGVFYQANVNGSGFTNPPLFSFTGTSGIEQTPEPSHTALPVGIAAGLLVLRRRRVNR